MARTRKTQSEVEKMTPQNIERVIELLDPKLPDQKPITKKDACQILGMSYNTTRLAQVLEDYKQKKQREKDNRDKKRGKPADLSEIKFAVSDYLKGESVDQIAKSLYRTSYFVKKILEDHNIPIRNTSYNYFKPSLIPEAAVRDRFQLAEVVYSARYDSTARIDSEQWSTQHKCWVYRIWLISDKWQQYAYQEAAELASLEHVQELYKRAA
jgi:hypothetical protein